MISFHHGGSVMHRWNKRIILFWAKAIMEPLWTFSTMKWTATRRERGIKIERICELMKKKAAGGKTQTWTQRERKMTKNPVWICREGSGLRQEEASDREMKVL